MSKAFALIYFNNTKKIYYGAYDGTVDLLYPNICTPKECYNEELDCYGSIGYCQKTYQNDYYIKIEKYSDIDDVEIYSDYGGGFYWKGKGSEQGKLIHYNYLDPWNNNSPIDGIPQWAINFLKKRNNKK